MQKLQSVISVCTCSPSNSIEFKEGMMGLRRFSGEKVELVWDPRVSPEVERLVCV